MMDGSLVLILHTHLPYVLHHGKWPHGSDWLAEAAAECYIPILNELRALVEEGITPNITLSLSPVVVEQLADPDFADIFNAYLDEKIEAAESDHTLFQTSRTERHFLPLAEFWREWYSARKAEFNGVYRTDLVGAFRELMESGAIALQTCGATHGYFPLLSRDRSIEAQLSVAVENHERHFGRAPRGVWMPECAYRPAGMWYPPVPGTNAPAEMRRGVEELIARAGLEYSIVDSHLTRGGRPLGVYGALHPAVRNVVDEEGGFLPLDDSRSVYDLYRVSSSSDEDADTMAIFTRDAETTLRVWSGAYGYPGDPEYLEFHKKHHNSGLRYWRVTDPSIDLGLKTAYRPEAVAARIGTHAAHFVAIVEGALRAFRRASGREGVVSAPFDTELFGHWWFEGPRFLGEVLRRLARSRGARARTAPDELDARDPGLVIGIPEGSWGDGGAHAVWLNNETAWTWPLIYEVESVVADLLNGAPADDPLDARLLRQLAREHLLVQSSDWQFLITTASAADYATERLVGHYNNAMRLAETLRSLRAGRGPSAAAIEDLEMLESVNRLFPEIDPNHWRDGVPSAAARVNA